MSGTTYANLRELREKLLTYKVESVSRMTGITPTRLAGIEAAEAEPTIDELVRLSHLYGVEAEALGELPIVIDARDSIRTLPSIPEYADVGDGVRARIVAAATAARQLRELERLHGLPAPNLEPLLKGLAAPRKNQAPYRQGSDVAKDVRERLKLGAKPIASVRDLVRDRFPRIALLYADLGSDGPAGLTFADALRGPTIVLNLAGKNTNPAVRRFSLAHELCHLLVDWRNRDPLAVLSGYLNDLQLERERRANAFAVRFLCPENVLNKLSSENPTAAAAALAKHGLHYAAARLYLRNTKSIELPAQPDPSVPVAGTEWEALETPLGVEPFVLPEVPAERRTRIAELAARAYSAGRIRRDRFAEYLGVTPASEVEKVLDRFGLEQPAEAA